MASLGTLQPEYKVLAFEALAKTKTKADQGTVPSYERRTAILEGAVAVRRGLGSYGGGGGAWSV